MRITPVIAVVVSVGLSACSTTKSDPGSDGFRVPGSGLMSPSDVQKAKEQLVSNAKSSAAKAGVQQAVAGDIQPGVLVIGNVGSLRKLEGDVRTQFYKESYVRDAEKWHPGERAQMSETEFTSQVAGYTGIVTWSIPGFVSRRSTAVVRQADVEKIDFPGKMNATMWGTTGDLVVASSNADGMIFVDHVLCKDEDSDYSKCAAQYARGNFDKNTGAELGSGMVPKSDGAHIDVTTFRAIFK